MHPKTCYNGYTPKGIGIYGDSPGRPNSGYAQSTTTYPAPNPFIAAVAAAAAVGYSSGVPAALHLSNMIGSGNNDAASYASRYQAAYQSYQNQYYNDYYQQYANQQRHSSAFQPAAGYGIQQVAQQLPNPQVSTTATQKPPSPFRQLPSQAPKTTSSPMRKSKKRPPSETGKVAVSDAKKKEEFEKLVKARTDKLLSDGPSFSPLTVGEPGSTTSSTSSCLSLSNSADGLSPAAVIASTNARLLRAIVNEKTRHLFKSAAVRKILRSRQLVLETYKRHNELFAVQMNSSRSGS